MSFHWPSFFLGALSVPLAVALGALVLRWLAGFPGRFDAGRLDGPGTSTGTLEPLNFTPRLIGQIGRPPAEVEESARAS